MKLDEFITETLSNIVSGVRKAQELEGVGPFVVPGGDGGHNYANHPRFSNSARLKSTIVDFDIALTVEESERASGSGGLRVAGFGAKLDAENASKDTTISRIQFSVPVLLPASQKQWHQELKDE